MTPDSVLALIKNSNPTEHGILLDHELRRSIFLNGRIRGGVSEGFRLTHNGFAILKTLVESFEFDLSEKEYRVCSRHILLFDRNLNSPWYLTHKTLALFDPEIAMRFKLTGLDINLLINLIDSD